MLIQHNLRNGLLICIQHNRRIDDLFRVIRGIGRNGNRRRKHTEANIRNLYQGICFLDNDIHIRSFFLGLDIGKLFENEGHHNVIDIVGKHQYIGGFADLIQLGIILVADPQFNQSCCIIQTFLLHLHDVRIDLIRIANSAEVGRHSGILIESIRDDVSANIGSPIKATCDRHNRFNTHYYFLLYRNKIRITILLFMT